MRLPIGFPGKFALWGALLFGIAGAGFAYLDYRLAVRQIESVAAAGNGFLARVLWNRLQPELPGLDHKASAAARAGLSGAAPAAEIARIDAMVRETARGTNVRGITVFDWSGRVLYATDHAEIGRERGADRRFRGARNGRTVHDTRWFERLETAGGPEFGREMMATFIPMAIAHDDHVHEMVFEVMSDLTPLKSAATRSAMALLAVTVVVMGVLYVTLVVIVFRGNRELRRAHRARLAAANEAARATAASDAKSAFLAHMSHELRTPLNAIMGFSDLIAHGAGGMLKKETVVEYAKDIGASAAHLLRIINDLLDLTGMELGRVQLEVDKTDLAALVNESMLMVQAQAADAGIILGKNVADDLPIVETDRHRLRQIMLNLLGNAVKFTPEGGSVTVRAHRDRGAERVVIEIVDTGVGMLEDTVEERMDVNRYGKAIVARKSAGAGLGLPISRRFAALLGAALEIESEVDRGTTARIAVPVAWHGGPRAGDAEGPRSEKAGAAA